MNDLLIALAIFAAGFGAALELAGRARRGRDRRPHDPA